MILHEKQKMSRSLLDLYQLKIANLSKNLVTHFVISTSCSWNKCYRKYLLQFFLAWKTLASSITFFNDRSFRNFNRPKTIKSKTHFFCEILHWVVLRCVRTVRIRSYSGPYFPAIELISRISRVSLYSLRMLENAD